MLYTLTAPNYGVFYSIKSISCNISWLQASSDSALTCRLTYTARFITDRSILQFFTARLILLFLM